MLDRMNWLIDLFCKLKNDEFKEIENVFELFISLKLEYRR